MAEHCPLDYLGDEGVRDSSSFSVFSGQFRVGFLDVWTGFVEAVRGAIVVFEVLDDAAFEFLSELIDLDFLYQLFLGDFAV